MLSPSSGSAAKAGGVGFSEEPATAATGTPSHVHFDEKLHDSVVMVIPQPDGNFMVKVGGGGDWQFNMSDVTMTITVGKNGTPRELGYSETYPLISSSPTVTLLYL